MIKDMRPSGVTRSHCGLVWVFVSCFMLAACLAANGKVDLQVTDKVWARCEQNVSLTCNATSSQQWDIEIKKFFWQLGNKTMCQYEQNHTEHGSECERNNSTFSRAITLRLQNVQLTDEGEYLCKLHTTWGAWNNKSQLRIQDCLKNSSTSKNNTHTECSFYGVYPSGVVHWFQGDRNLTENTITHETRDKRDRFIISSAIEQKKLKQSEPYNCSLWIPSLSRYLSTQVNSASSNSGCLIKLQWISVVVMVTVSFVM